MERKLSDSVDAILARFGPPDSGKIWFVSYSFQRLLPSSKKLRAAILKSLEGFPESFSTRDIGSIQLHQNFKLLFAEAGVPLDQKFELGGYCDLDSGGWVQSELIRNVQLCMDEKAGKIKAIEGLYDEWWLVLVDHVSLAIVPSLLDGEFLKRHVTIQKIWDKVVLLSPSDHRQWNWL